MRNCEARVVMSVGLKNRTVGIVAAAGFDDSQLFKVARELSARKAVIKIIGVDGFRSIVGAHGSKVDPDTILEKTGARELDAIIVPGGDYLVSIQANDRLLTLLIEAQTLGRPIGAIGNGPAALALAGLLRERRVTGDSRIRLILSEAGARYLDQALVVDHNVVTSRDGSDIMHLIDAIAFLLEPAASRR